MTMITLQADRRNPVPATGRHAELLAEMTQRTNVLLRLIEAERTGVFDGLGQRFWVDPVLLAARRLVALANERVGVVPR